jgi:chromosome segregation ATPase
MSTAAKEDTCVPMPGAVAIGELPFVTQRLALLLADPHDANARQHAQDRTSQAVFKWKILTDQLPKIRSSTTSCLEAVEGKGGAITLRIANREQYDTTQAAITEHTDQIIALERAIRELDALHCGWLDEMRGQRDSLSAVENQQRAMLTSWATSALQKKVHARMSAEDVLAKDEIYQDKKAKVESQIARAKTALDALIPQIEKIEDILRGVGC